MVALTPENLVAAYAQGVFPMDVAGEVRWFSPNPRAILPLEAVHFSKNLLRRYRSGRFEIRTDGDFAGVIRGCAERAEETWISGEIIQAYTRLFELGLAHTVEAWRAGRLVGGLYGVALGGAFFGESMFHRETDASKVALVALVERLRARGYSLLDVQWETEHLRKFGVIAIGRREYLRRLKAALGQECAWDAECGVRNVE